MNYSKIIQLSKKDITEIKNIIDYLNSNDEETFKLGKSLFETSFPANMLIPVNDIFIPLLNSWECLWFFRFPLSIPCGDVNIVTSLLEHLIQSKYYVLPQNNRR